MSSRIRLIMVDFRNVTVKKEVFLLIITSSYSMVNRQKNLINIENDLSKNTSIYNFWSLPDGIYRTISFISQFKIRHRSFSVLVDTSLLCFKR